MFDDVIEHTQANSALFRGAAVFQQVAEERHQGVYQLHGGIAVSAQDDCETAGDLIRQLALLFVVVLRIQAMCQATCYAAEDPQIAEQLQRRCA